MIYLSDDLADALGIPVAEADELIADVGAFLPSDLSYLNDPDPLPDDLEDEGF